MLNKTDEAMISLLRVNARTPVSTLAKKLGVSRATVQNRLERLEQTGVICGYTLILKPEVEQQQVRAMMFVTVEGQKESKVINELRGFPNVTALYGTNGHWDLVLDVRTDSLASFHELLVQVRQIEGIVTTETTILLSSFNH